MNKEPYQMEKPAGYLSHFIVDDPHPILVINVEGSSWQLSKALGREGEMYEVTAEGDFLTIKYIGYE